MQGARQVKASPLGSSTLFVFVKPPSLDALESRLRGRGSEDDQSVRRRLDNATEELRSADDADFVDTTIVNDDVDAAYRELCAALAAHLGVTVDVGADGDAAAAPAAASADAVAPRSPDADDAPMLKAAGDEVDAGAGQMGSDAGPSGSALDLAGVGAAGGGGSERGSAENATDYLNTTVVTALREALGALNESRPADPMQFLIEELSRMKAQQPA